MSETRPTITLQEWERVDADPKKERPLLPLIHMAETIRGNNHAGVHSAKRQ